MRNLLNLEGSNERKDRYLPKRSFFVSGKVMRDWSWSTRFVARLKKIGTAIQTAVLAQRMSVDQVLERVGIGLIRCHNSGRPAFRKPSTK